MGMRLDRDPDQPVLVAGSPDWHPGRVLAQEQAGTQHRIADASAGVDAGPEQEAEMPGLNRERQAIEAAAVAEAEAEMGMRLDRDPDQPVLVCRRPRSGPRTGAGGHPASNRRCVRRR
jgi:hypothetical protein